jgi:hypothetical protein
MLGLCPAVVYMYLARNTAMKVHLKYRQEHLIPLSEIYIKFTVMYRTSLHTQSTFWSISVDPKILQIWGDIWSSTSLLYTIWKLTVRWKSWSTEFYILLSKIHSTLRPLRHNWQTPVWETAIHSFMVWGLDIDAALHSCFTCMRISKNWLHRLIMIKLKFFFVNRSWTT